jgi:hypothetical protein
MGGNAKANIATSMVPSADSYRIIPVPLGLFQVLDNVDRFNPSSDEFDPARAIERASNPLHYTFGRNSGTSDDAQARFMRDLVNVEINRDLTTYQGFHLPGDVAGEGLASPAWGGTIKFKKGASGSFQGVFIGAGPYLSYSTMAVFDPKLVDVLESGARYPNSTLFLRNNSEVQLALSIVGGYRARFALPGADGERDGAYVAVNYRHLRGFEYLKPDTEVRLDMDSQALLTARPGSAPIEIVTLEGKGGTGRAVDVGVQVVRGRWEAGVGVNGIGNRIDWNDLTVKRFTAQSLLTGGDFDEEDTPAPFDTWRVELPVVTTGNVGYDDGTNALRGSVTHGFNGNSFNGGGERWFGALAARAGARYSRGFWDPAFGIGVGRRIGVDVGFYGTHANLQEKRQYSMAIAVRLGGNQ